MASDPYNGYTAVDRGKDLLGQRWEVGVRGPGMVLEVSGRVQPCHQLAFDGEPLERFAEAVARAQQLAQAWRPAAAEAAG